MRRYPWRRASRSDRRPSINKPVLAKSGQGFGQRPRFQQDAQATETILREGSKEVAERDECLRCVWKKMLAAWTEAGRLLFVDECSTNISPRPLYAGSRKGEPAPCSAPCN